MPRQTPLSGNPADQTAQPDSDSARRGEMSEETFSINGDPRNNYVNLILNDMKNFNFYNQNRMFPEAVKALGILLSDLPPTGQEYMKQEIELIYEFDGKSTSAIPTWEKASRMYQKAISWVWPNMLQEYFQAKPRNPQPTTLGE
jgi:hypothetical protein